MSTTEKHVTEHLYKVLVIGEFGVGTKGTYTELTDASGQKTSIIRRYTEDRFSSNYKLTIGVDFALKPIEWDNTKRVNLQLWDIAGHERFGHMTRVYYKYAIAAVIVFDLSRPATFDSVLKWYTDVNQKVMLANEQPVPVLLIANKCDLEDTVLDAKMLEDFCHQHNFIGWFATSAKDNINIEEAMRFLVQNILELTADSSKPNEHISLHQDKEYFETIEEEEEDNLSLAEERNARRCCPT